MNHIRCVLALALLPTSAAVAESQVGARVARLGDEIVVCGGLVHAGTPVVTWMDPGGYDAYRVERRFVPIDRAGWDATSKEGKLKGPVRFGMRKAGLSDEAIERVRGGGWDLPTLQGAVDQFVIHFDARGTSRGCFQVLHDERGLSVHFLLDLDGTLYQTLDLKEAAWHATKANGRSIGIEIANVGTAPAVGEGSDRLDRWYRREGDDLTRIILPEPTGMHDPSAPLRPIRPAPVVGRIQGQDLRQYDLTAAQYEALIRLTATLRSVFPRIRLDYPRDGSGGLVREKLADDDYARYHGLLGHYHVQTNKVDPGPAFQWDRLIDGVKAIEAGR